MRTHGRHVRGSRAAIVAAGTHHWVSPKHLQQYVSEMAWRMNRRAMTAEDRINALFTAIEGRLTYKALIA